MQVKCKLYKLLFEQCQISRFDLVQFSIHYQPP